MSSTVAPGWSVSSAAPTASARSTGTPTSSRYRRAKPARSVPSVQSHQARLSGSRIAIIRRNRAALRFSKKYSTDGGASWCVMRPHCHTPRVASSIFARLCPRCGAAHLRNRRALTLARHPFRRWSFARGRSPLGPAPLDTAAAHGRNRSVGSNRGFSLRRRLLPSWPVWLEAQSPVRICPRPRGIFCRAPISPGASASFFSACLGAPLARRPRGNP